LVYKADNIEDTHLHYEKGIYLHQLNEDLNLFYHHQLHEFMIQYTVKPITWTSKPWPHNQPLHQEPVKCNHPRTWNKHSREAVEIQRICGEKSYELHYEEHIRPAITGILDQIRRVRQKLLQDELDLAEYESKLIQIRDWEPCHECDCPDKCYRYGLCGTGCTNPQRRCDNNKEGGDLK